MASKTVEGVVEAISSNSGTSGKGGTWTSKSFKIDGEWYGGFIDADNKARVTAAGEGDTIKMVVEKNAKGYWNYSDKFKVVSTGVKVNDAAGGTTSLGQFTREYGMALGKASGVVQGLAIAGKITTPGKASSAIIAIGKTLMEEIWLATPEKLGFVETEEAVVEPPVEEAEVETEKDDEWTED